jgi:hypothetical protein
MTKISRRLFLSVLCFLLSVLLLSCSKKKSDDPAAAAILESGKGAVLVVFPHRSDLVRENWMAHVRLQGQNLTDSLPRIPFADLESVLVLNVPEGNYEITAWAWMKKVDRSPRAGGSKPGVKVKSGHVTILRAREAASGMRPLDAMGEADWNESNPTHLQDFMADVIDKSAKG